MNLKSLVTTAIAAIFLISCTKEVIKEVYVGGDGIETGETFVTFTLDANMVKTKAADDHDSYEPTEDENKIYNYALFIFKSNGMLEATLIGKSPALDEPIEFTDHQGTLTFQKEYNPNLTWNDTGDAIRISAGAKTFFAIVNAPFEYVGDQNSFVNNPTLTLDELKDITLTLGGDLNKIVGEYRNGFVSLTNPVETGDNRGFLMTNIIADGQSDGYYRRTLEEKDEDDPAINITVTVGRAMAKVSLASDLASYDAIISDNTIDLSQQYGTLDTKEYKIINNPNEMNIALKVSSGIVMTPYMGNGTVNTNNYFISNNDEVNTTHPKESYYIPVSTEDEKTFNYCIENANNKPKYGNASIALIKGHYTPLTGDVGRATIMDDNFIVQTTSLQPKQDFWRIWIKPYTDTNGNPQGGVYAEEYFIAEPDSEAYKAHKNWTDPNIKLEVYKYPEGLCYYYLPLKNADSNSPYTVVRNSYYKIDIKSVDGPGYPEDPDKPGEPGGPDKPGPEVPIEEQTNIHASIKVANWDEVKQTGNL